MSSGIMVGEESIELGLVGAEGEVDAVEEGGFVNESNGAKANGAAASGDGNNKTNPPPSDVKYVYPGYPLPVGDVTCCFPRTLTSSDSPALPKLLWGWIRTNQSQLLSGITVALAQIPEAVSFSFVAGVDPIVGLQSAWILGICTSLLGGRPGMVSGATGAVAVVLTGLIKEHGLGHLFYAIMLAGLLQIAFGLCRLGVLVRMIPHPVMVGFCNGLGIVIAVAQFNIFKVLPEEGSEDGHGRRLNALFGAFTPFTNGHDWIDPVMGGWMAFHIFATVAVYATFSKVPVIGKAIPGSLAAIIVSTALEWALVRPLGFQTNTVKDLASVAGAFPVPVWIDTRYATRT